MDYEQLELELYLELGYSERRAFAEDIVRRNMRGELWREFRASEDCDPAFRMDFVDSLYDKGMEAYDERFRVRDDGGGELWQRSPLYAALDDAACLAWHDANKR